MLQEVVTWPLKNFINIYKFVLVYYIRNDDFSPEWVGETGVQMDTMLYSKLVDVLWSVEYTLPHLLP